MNTNIPSLITVDNTFQATARKLSTHHDLAAKTSRQTLETIMSILTGTRQDVNMTYEQLTNVAALIETSLQYRDAFLIASLNPQATQDDLTTCTEHPHSQEAILLITGTLDKFFNIEDYTDQTRVNRAIHLLDQLTRITGMTPQLCTTRAYLSWASHDIEQTKQYASMTAELDKDNTLAALLLAALHLNINPKTK